MDTCRNVASYLSILKAFLSFAATSGGSSAKSLSIFSIISSLLGAKSPKKPAIHRTASTGQPKYSASLLQILWDAYPFFSASEIVWFDTPISSANLRWDMPFHVRSVESQVDAKLLIRSSFSSRGLFDFTIWRHNKSVR